MTTKPKADAKLPAASSTPADLTMPAELVETENWAPDDQDDDGHDLTEALLAFCTHIAAAVPTEETRRLLADLRVASGHDDVEPV